MSSLIPHHTGLYTDFYELTMAQGYVLSGKAEAPACFDYFFRENPFKGGYVVFAGLTDLLETLENFAYGEEDLEYLKSLGFQKPFLDYLKNFHFKGRIYSVREGEVVFPLEPVLRVEGRHPGFPGGPDRRSHRHLQRLFFVPLVPFPFRHPGPFLGPKLPRRTDGLPQVRRNLS